MNTLILITEAIHNATKRLGWGIGLEITEDHKATPIYLILEDNGEVLEEFYDIYQAISYINQMEL